MKPKHQRLILAVLAVAGIAGAGLLAANGLRNDAAYFRTPAEVAAGKAETGEAMRLGGMVVKGSIQRAADGVTIRFAATDGKATVPVQYTGIVPDLFKEESGMVADGRMRADGVFVADRILAKHDERYMPPQMGDIPADGVFVADRILAKHDERYMPPQMGDIPADAGRSPGREPINGAFEASKWQRDRSEMSAGDSHSIAKGISLRDRSHFGVLRIWPILSIAALANLEISTYSIASPPCTEQNGLKPRTRHLWVHGLAPETAAK